MIKQTELNVLRLKLSLLEAAQSHMRVNYAKLRIETGSYKDKLGHCWKGGLPEHGGVLMTLDEIKDAELATMRAHIHWADEHLEHAKGLLDEIQQQGVTND